MPPDIKHGFQFEKEFQFRWNSLGKRAWLYRFEDVKDLYGINDKTIINGFQKPADFLAVFNGWTSLIECKATKNIKGFPTSLLEKAQISAATRMIAAQGNYTIAIRRMSDGVTYLVPATVVLNGKGVLPWDTLLPYQWLGILPCLNTRIA